MLLLEGNDLWVNLKTSFVDIDELLLFLKKQNYLFVFSLFRAFVIGCVFVSQHTGISPSFQRTIPDFATLQKISTRRRPDRSWHRSLE